MSLCFHIIYTPGTVQPLRLFLYSLLKWSDCTFCLVANGCSSAERQLLQDLCASNPRLSYQALPTDKIMLHGQALDHLQAQNQHDYFCFMDSDIYAVAPFLPAFQAQLAHYCGLFSATPLRYPQTGLPLPDDQPFVAGPYTHTRANLCLGTTFFAIYHNAVITELRRTTGISFRRYRWEEIPAVYQASLQALSIQRQQYDTAKLLNLLLHLQNQPLRYQPCLALRHIEAVSRLVVLQQRSWWHRLRVYAGQLRQRVASKPLKLSYDEALPQVNQLLWALAYNKVLPAPPTVTNTAHSWVAQTWQELLALHQEFANVTDDPSSCSR